MPNNKIWKRPILKQKISKWLLNTLHSTLRHKNVINDDQSPSRVYYYSNYMSLTNCPNSYTTDAQITRSYRLFTSKIRYERRSITKPTNAVKAEVVISQSNSTNIHNLHFNRHLTCRLVRARYRPNVEFLYLWELRVRICKAIEWKLHTNLLAFNEFTSLLNSLQLERYMQNITVKSRIEFPESSSTLTPSSMHRWIYFVFATNLFSLSHSVYVFSSS